MIIKIGEKICELRNKHNLTQYALARKLGVTRSSVNAWEMGISIPTVERIIDIAETEGIPVYRDDSASSVLCMLDVGTQIPRELYETVAIIYAQILSTASQTKQNTKPKTNK